MLRRPFSSTLTRPFAPSIRLSCSKSFFFCLNSIHTPTTPFTMDVLRRNSTSAAAPAPPTLPHHEQVLVDIRSIKNASDFSKLVAGQWLWNGSIFPPDHDSSPIEASLDKISELAPLQLPRENSYDENHSWMNCILNLAEKSDCFRNAQHPRHAAVHRRFVNALMTSFTLQPTQGRDESIDCSTYVVRTLAKAMFPKGEPRRLCGASDALTDFLVAHKNTAIRLPWSIRDSVISFLAQTLLDAPDAAKRIVQLSDKNPEDWLPDEVGTTIDEATTVPASLSDPEHLRIWFRALHDAKNKGCCTTLQAVLTAILKKTASLPSSFLNTPLNLPDQHGHMIEDTPLSIVCDRNRYCDLVRSSDAICSQLIKLGANVNGLVDDPANPGKKIVCRRDGKTPLMLACASGDDGTIELFLKNKNVDLSLKDREENSATKYLLRRYECAYCLAELFNRDPLLFTQHVTFADLEFAIRNCFESSFAFLLNNINFTTAQLQETLNICFKELLTVAPDTNQKDDPLQNRCETANRESCEEYSRDIYCKRGCGYEGPHPRGRKYRKLRREPPPPLYTSYLIWCIRLLLEKIHKSGGIASIPVSFRDACEEKTKNK